MKKSIASLFLLMWSLNVLPSTLIDTLYISNYVDTIGGYFAHYRTFHRIDTIDKANTEIHINENDSLQITIINLDSLTHDFTIDGVLDSNNNIYSGDTANFTLSFSSIGSYRYYSSYAYGKLLSASGIILVGYDNYKKFYWNLFDQQSTLTDSIAHGWIDSIPPSYHPELFSINNSIYPDILSDSTGHVVGNVGDTLIIAIINSGNMAHSLHFHGYHVKILDAKINNHIVGWDKDTFPVVMNERITVMLIPDKEGMYPVHDHNLISVNTGGYPGGMITSLMISP